MVKSKKINSKSQLHVQNKNHIKKENNLKDKNLRNKEKIERSEKVNNIPKVDNLYRANKKKHKKIIHITVGEYDDKFRNGRPPNIHKRGSTYKIKKLRKKNIRQKPNRKEVKSKSKITISYGECSVCYEDKEINSKNTITCGGVKHILCQDCKEKIKDNKCPLCRTHPIDPKRKEKNINENDRNNLYTDLMRYLTSFDDLQLADREYYMYREYMYRYIPPFRDAY